MRTFLRTLSVAVLLLSTSFVSSKAVEQKTLAIVNATGTSFIEFSLWPESGTSVPQDIPLFSELPKDTGLVTSPLHPWSSAIAYINKGDCNFVFTAFTNTGKFITANVNACSGDGTFMIKAPRTII